MVLEELKLNLMYETSYNQFVKHCLILINQWTTHDDTLFSFAQGNWKLPGREAGYSVHFWWAMGVVPVSFKAVRVSLKTKMENNWCTKLQGNKMRGVSCIEFEMQMTLNKYYKISRAVNYLVRSEWELFWADKVVTNLKLTHCSEHESAVLHNGL